MSRCFLLSPVILASFSLIAANAEASQVCLVGPRGADVYVRNGRGERIGAVPSRTLAEAVQGVGTGRDTAIEIPSSQLSGFVQTQFVRASSECDASPDEPVEPTPAPTAAPTPVHPQAGQDPFQCSRTFGGGEAASKCNRQALSELADSGRHTLGYNGARERMFQFVDIFSGSHGQKSIQSVYSNDVLEVRCEGIPQDGFNTEHTWPQSKLKEYPRFEETRADIYHLFPVEIAINGARGNLPFRECSGEPEAKGRVPEFCDGGFEAPEVHKGVVARAMFYMAVTYGMSIDSQQESILRHWNQEFPPTTDERTRGSRIQQAQGNVNPFIEHPEWVELISDY